MDVHPQRWAFSTKRRVTTGRGPKRGGTCKTSTSRARSRRSSPIIAASVASAPPSAQRRADQALYLTGAPTAERRDTDAIFDPKRTNRGGEGLDRSIGLRIDVDVGVGKPFEELVEAEDGFGTTHCAAATSLHGRSAMRPDPSVTRSRTSSWNATSTPSLVTCTSVSR